MPEVPGFWRFMLSGADWVERFPTSKSVEDLVEPFRSNLKNFLKALQSAGAKVLISATVRPKERAYLMHYSYLVGHANMNPAAVPAMAGVDIEWVHKDQLGNKDSAASIAAAQAMVRGYGIVYCPVLESRHTQGQAVDMTISWEGNLHLTYSHGGSITATGDLRSGSHPVLIHVGESYGVHKLQSDPPHWSLDGH